MRLDAAPHCEGHALHLQVSIQKQTLSIIDASDKEVGCFAISTARKGAGELKNSEQTPRGWHVIRAKIGHNLPLNAVMVGRRFTGELYTPELEKAFPGRDWILTRILWLSGLEVGKNRLGNVDTMQRYIYIHGFPDGYPIGVPDSHGCIRMRNCDIVKLFDFIEYGTKIYIGETDK